MGIFLPLVSYFIGITSQNYIQFVLTINILVISLNTLLINLIFSHWRIKKLRYYYLSIFLPSFIFSLKYCTVEPLAIFFLLLGLWLYYKQKYLLSSLIISFGILTKETILLLPVGILTFQLIYGLKNKMKLLNLINKKFCVYFHHRSWLDIAH